MAQSQHANSSPVKFIASNKIHATENMSNKAKSTESAQAKSGFGEWPKVGSTMKQRSPEKKENALPKEFSQKNPHSRIEVADGEQNNAINKGVESLQDISESLMATLWELVNAQLHILK
ncbi:hypothetical protein OXX69_010213 [Metschnikowia pulcherrima]